MSTLPPSPFLNSAAVVMPSADVPVAVSSPLSPLSETAAGPNPVTSALADLPLDDDISNIPEIFYYARKLARDRRFVLNEREFMDAIDPPPMFLQRAG